MPDAYGCPITEAIVVLQKSCCTGQEALVCGRSVGLQTKGFARVHAIRPFAYTPLWLACRRKLSPPKGLTHWLGGPVGVSEIAISSSAVPRSVQTATCTSGGHVMSSQ